MLIKQRISLLLLLLSIASCFTAEHQDDESSTVAPLVRKEEREPIAVTEFGRISAVEINDGIKGPYHLQFITLEPNALFLPVLLHADMVFFVQTGNGTVSWVDEEDQNQINVKQGDIYRIRSGSVFFVTSSLDDEREKLRICAIFTNSVEFEYSQIRSEPYSSLRDLVTGFDTKVLQAAFQVPEEVIASIKQKSQTPPIVHAPSANTTESDWTRGILRLLTGGPFGVNSKKKKTKTYNIMERKPDFENCNGWSKTVNRKDLSALKGSDIGVFMVNLTQGSMMGPHWNPRASEIAIVIHGQGMIRVVCSSVATESGCKNRRFLVKEGDVFAVPRFHPMAQMAFNNDTFVFMGFSTMARKNYPQFLAGKRSVLQTLDRDVVAASFNAPNATIDTLLSSQADSIILGCVSCAEEEERGMQEEIERERQEEAAARRREEEEAARRREEEEAARRREEEEAARRQEEEAARRREEEEAARRKEEEEAARRQEEEAARRKEEEEAARRQQEEEAARKQEEEAARRREEEEEAARRQEEEAQAREEEKRAQEEEERREEAARRQEEETARRQEKERERREQEEGGQWGQEGDVEGGGYHLNRKIFLF